MLKGLSIGSIVTSVIQIVDGMPLMWLASLAAMASPAAAFVMYLPVVGGVIGIAAGILLLLRKRVGSITALVGGVVSVIFAALMAIGLSDMPGGGINRLLIVCIINAVLLVLAFINGRKMPAQNAQ